MKYNFINKYNSKLVYQWSFFIFKNRVYKQTARMQLTNKYIVCKV